MIITELKKPIIDRRIIQLVQDGKIKIVDAAILWMETRTCYLQPILIQSERGDDVIELLDWIYQTDNNILELYNSNEVLTNEYMDEHYIPINGGEYYTNMVHDIEYI